MSRFRVFSILVILLSAGCVRAPAEQVTSSLPHSATPGSQRSPSISNIASSTITDLYPTIVNIYGESPDILNIPGKYQCGQYSVNPPDFTEGRPPQEALVLQPFGKTLLRLAAEPVFQYDATFSRDCTDVYWVNSLERGTHIHTFDIPTNTATMLTIPNSSFPKNLAMDSYYPTPAFVYAIDNTHLLLSFQNMTTGRDSNSNQSTQALFDLTTQTATFLSGGGLPVLLNYKTNTLIYSEPGGEGIIGRVEINLNTGMRTTFPVTKSYPFGPPCDPTVLNQAEYDACNPNSLEVKNQWLNKLFNN